MCSVKIFKGDYEFERERVEKHGKSWGEEREARKLCQFSQEILKKLRNHFIVS